MSTEGLMQKRFKVIGDYPDSKFNVDEVIEFTEKDFSGRPILRVWEHDGYTAYAPHDFERYPHLFRPLA